MATIDSYVVNARNIDALVDELNFHFRSIADRLDKQEGIRGIFRREYDVEALKRNDNRPYVGDGDLFKTVNNESTTIVDFVGGFNGHQIWILIDDPYTTLDFVNGNIRERTGKLDSWVASTGQLLTAFYCEDIWYTEFWDFGGESNNWQYVDIDGDYTLTEEDVGKIIRSNTADAHTVYIPNAIMEEGEQIVFYQKGAGQMTLAEDGFTINTPSTLVVNEQYGTITLIAESSTEGFIAGRMSAA